MNDDSAAPQQDLPAEARSASPLLDDFAAEASLPDGATLRAHIRDKYREVAVDPHGTFHFHTGRRLAARLGYDPADVDALPDRAVESFAGVGNPFSLRRLAARRARRRRRLRRRVRQLRRRRPGRGRPGGSSGST